MSGKRNRGLGRGLEALIPQNAGEAESAGLKEIEGARFAELPVGSIEPNPRQPRTVFDEDAMAELVHSITEIGLLQPIVVREVGPEKFELIMGERRWRAHREAGLETIAAVVRETQDEDLLRDALLENLHRSELNPLEEAAAYQQLLDDFGCTHEELASRIGRSRPQISNTLRLLRLTPAVQRRVAAGVLSAGHARALVTVANSEIQERLATREKQWKFDPADLDKRRRWVAYRQAFEAALTRCSTAHAPWYVIPADRKWFRDLAVSQILRQEMEALPLEWPKPAYDPKRIRVI